MTIKKMDNIWQYNIIKKAFSGEEVSIDEMKAFCEEYQKEFDYHGYHNRDEWLKNKIRSLVSEGAKEDALRRKAQLNAYYDAHPEELESRGIKESKESYDKKIKGYENQSLGAEEEKEDLDKIRASNKEEVRKGFKKYATSKKGKLMDAASVGLVAAAPAIIPLIPVLGMFLPAVVFLSSAHFIAMAIAAAKTVTTTTAGSYALAAYKSKLRTAVNEAKVKYKDKIKAIKRSINLKEKVQYATKRFIRVFKKLTDSLKKLKAFLKKAAQEFLKVKTEKEFINSSAKLAALNYLVESKVA